MDAWKAKYDLINKPIWIEHQGRLQQCWLNHVKNDLIRIDETLVIEEADDRNR